MSEEDYGWSEEDAESTGGGERTALPRDKYTGQISRAEIKKDKNKKSYYKFGISITHGKLKRALAFENYLPLGRGENAFKVARRNSFFKAIGLQPNTLPPGIDPDKDVSLLNDTYVDFTVEHEFEDVPGEQYSLTTSKSSKLRWLDEGWEDCLDANGNLVKNPKGEVFDEPVKPRTLITFYAVSDEFEGLGGGVEDEPEDEGWGG